MLINDISKIQNYKDIEFVHIGRFKDVLIASTYIRTTAMFCNRGFLVQSQLTLHCLKKVGNWN